MRIVGGKFRGRSIVVPKTRDTRPTMDRTREAVFNMLLNASWSKKEDGTSFLRGAIVLDVFAGSGAYGFEALSHGAEHVTFFDNTREATHALEQNISKLDVEQSAKIVQGNALTPIVSKYPVATVAFFDPPYGKELIAETITTLHTKNWINEQTVLVIETESHKPDALPARFDVLSDRVYGKSKVIIGHLI